ncbi:hypothetical protein [Actinokineospora sp. NBRC 105648]|uniref:hypothetical protein n=1 Tax=Actinokineospora sp. NBRC 105648 TaxID=3032206 RepID=UPI0024A34AC6|nr:hypothetical protein [Actinokineospora sp. NBRC 105648]GLZ37314.1 hypothetical protein Acsp05_09390 [Actinokineospora sp. NBRC 105648]
MTYPPQQPGPYGQQPQQPGGYGNQPPGPYGQQPDPYAQQPPYQGPGGFPGGPGGEPPKRNTGKIVAIVAIAVLVLGGAGVGVYFLTKDKGGSNTGSGTTSSAPKSPGRTTTGSSSSDETSSSSEPSTDDDSSGPDAVVDAYVDAYKTKSFLTVTSDACKAYKDKYGTDTSKLEGELEKFEITATKNGSPKVSGSTASAQIDLVLTQDGKSRNVTIEIKIVKEGGDWKFCGEQQG